jgi:hypothetical protein
MQTLSSLLGTLVTLAAPALAASSEFVEEFEGGSNVGGWAWGTGGESFSPLNGNPGAFLQDLTLVSCCPMLITAVQGGPSPFTGDYRAMGVTSVGVDLVTLDADFGVSGRPLTAILWNDNGTPANQNDDWGAYFIGDKDLPNPGVPIDGRTPAGWTSYDFEVDAASDAAPPGWTLFGGHTWSELVTDVDALGFYYGIPGQIYLIFAWDVGADNARIQFPDCNQNGVPDASEIASGQVPDLDGDGVPDPCQPLSGDVASLSVGAGGAQQLALLAGAEHVGALYLVLGTLSGTSPGLPVGDLVLPLQLDPYFLLTLTALSASPLTQSFGILAAPDGSASASFALPAGAPSPLVGAVANHAYVVLDPLTGAVEDVSNAFPVSFLP